MYTNTKLRNSSNKQTNTTKLLSLRLKYRILGLRSLTQTLKFKGELFANKSILDIETHFKPTETFQYTHFSSCHPLGVKKGFTKIEALLLLRTKSSENEFKTKISHFRTSLIERGYLESLITATLSDIKFENRKQALLQKCKKDKRILSFVTQYRPTVSNFKYLCKNGIWSSNNRYFAKYCKMPRPLHTKGADP